MIRTKIAQIANRSNSSALISAAGALIVLLALIYSTVHLFRLQSQIQGFESENERLKAEASVLETRNKELLGKNAAAAKDFAEKVAQESAGKEKQLAEKNEQVSRVMTLAFAGLGYKNPAKGNSALLERSLAAKSLAESLARTNRVRRSGLVFRYYPSDFERYLNGELLLTRFKAYGFRLEPVSSRAASASPNAIWCGVSVHSDDVRLVALTLISAGLEIRAIHPFRKTSDHNEHAIETGVDLSRARTPALTADEIMASASCQPEGR
jgi:hypothetical protein